MVEHAVGTREEWLAASGELLAAEKEHGRLVAPSRRVREVTHQ